MSRAERAAREAGEALARAHALHRAGQLEEAEKLYRNILVQQPTHVEALHLLGVLGGQRGETHAALLLLERAAQLAPQRLDIGTNLGVIYKMCGRFAEAETRFRRAAEANPRDAAAWNNLGTALHGQGRYAEAEAELRRALELRPDFREAQKNLAATLQDQQRSEEADALYSELLAAGSEDPEVYYNLALLRYARPDLPAAEEAARKALALRTDYPEAQIVLATVLEGRGRSEEAQQIYKHVHEARAEDVPAQFRIAQAFRGLQRWSDAVRAFQRVLRVNQDWIDALSPAAEALIAIHRYEMAERCCRRILAQDDAHRMARIRLSEALVHQGRDEEARAALAPLQEQYPQDPQVLRAAAQVELQAGCIDAARDYIDRALAEAPNHAASVLLLGRVQAEQGIFEEAQKNFHRAWHMQPANVGIGYSLAGIKRFEDPEDRDLKYLLAWDERRRALPALQRVCLDFALGKAFADLKDYDRAFTHYKAGNDTERELLVYDPRSQEANMTSVRAVFGPALFERFRGRGSGSEMPVFIVGMPRSGTTLIEQVLASHPQVAPGGELRLMSRLIAEIWPRKQGEGHLKAVEAAAPETVDRLAAGYQEGIEALANGCIRVTDKMPGNFVNIGLIRLAFPRARIIYSRRNPMDNCLSCYMTLFSSGHEYTYRLSELGHMYRLHAELMEYWRTLDEVEFLEVRYENMVSDLEAQARRLVDFVGLEWDPRCLEFHKTERAVATASLAQVRQPIYTSSVEKWRRYEKHLDELAKTLEKPVEA